MRFRKMHGLGNDFVILDFRNERKPLLPEMIEKICDRHFGVGCDQLVVLEKSEVADIKAIFYNADGSESGACGNATRCVADILMKERGVQACTVETGGGVLSAQAAENGMVTVDMGAPGLDWRQIPVSKPVDTLDINLTPHLNPPPFEGGRDGRGDAGEMRATCVSMGNPHCVIFVDNLEDICVETMGPEFENHPLFPQRTNVEFVQVLSTGKLRQKTWERGSGLTLACGSGACAVAVAGVRRGLAGRKVEVVLDGGSIFIEWREADGHVLMTGPVAYVFEGRLL